MNQDLIPSIANFLKANAAVTSLLANASDSIIPTQVLQSDNFPQLINLPVIMIQDNGTYGIGRDLPHFQTTVNLRVYDSAQSPNTTSYARINKIIWECINALDRQTVVSNASYYADFEIQWDNYISRDMWDEAYKLPVKVVRFRCFGATSIRNI